MSNDGSARLKTLIEQRRGPADRRLVDPLEEAWEAARDARDIMRDEQRRERQSLPEYTDENEDTKRTGVADLHVHVHQHSTPDVEVDASVEVGPVKVSGLPRWAVVAVGVVVAAGVALLAALRGH